MNEWFFLEHLTKGKSPWLEAYSNLIRTRENFEKSSKKKQHGRKVNYLKILLVEYAFTNLVKIFEKM